MYAKILPIRNNVYRNRAQLLLTIDMFHVLQFNSNTGQLDLKPPANI